VSVDPVRRPGRPSAADRILAAAARRLARDGAAAVSVQDVADEAGVSKALVHYHFHDKDALLARLAGDLAEALVARERGVFHDVDAAGAVDALWTWLRDELRAGELRVLLDLTASPAPPVREAARRAAHVRRAAAQRTVSTLFALLDLVPRVPVNMLADVVVAFVDGLAADAAVEPERNHRVAFDVFWLALLGLAE
jgi:AcrR family transcriptional regulator